MFYTREITTVYKTWGIEARAKLTHETATEVQPGPLQTSQMERFSTKNNCFLPLTIATKLSILDVCGGSGNVSGQSTGTFAVFYLNISATVFLLISAEAQISAAPSTLRPSNKCLPLLSAAPQNVVTDHNVTI